MGGGGHCSGSSKLLRNLVVLVQMLLYLLPDGRRENCLCEGWEGSLMMLAALCIVNAVPFEYVQQSWDTSADDLPLCFYKPVQLLTFGCCARSKPY